MKNILHRASDRFISNHGWLKSFHTFSFAHHYDPQRLNFGTLRVLNDDQVTPGRGFGTHPHSNMEIISVPLKGALKHQDNQGNSAVIKKGDVQIMSAGTGVLHSEFNHSQEEWAHFLQIWIFPKKKDIDPRYDQKTFSPGGRQNRWQVMVNPLDHSLGGIGINQNAYMAMADFETETIQSYVKFRPENIIYFFILEGEVGIRNQNLYERDAIGLFNAQEEIRILPKSNCELLALEVPEHEEH